MPDPLADRFAQVRGFSVEIQGCRGSRYVATDSISEWEAAESCGLSTDVTGNGTANRVGGVKYAHICLKRGSARSSTRGCSGGRCAG